MAERYAKGRLLQASEARDSAVRRLLDVLPDREAAFGAILLYHRIVARLDIQGAVTFEPSWLRAECFLGYPVTEEEVTTWADALLEVGLLREYLVDGIRYAWTPSFYRNNPGLRLEYEQPRYPRPPGWHLEELWPNDRPGQKPDAPSWARPGRAEPNQRDPAPPPPKNVVGGVVVWGASKAIDAAIERMETSLGERLAAAVRRYALQFVDAEKRAEASLQATTYHAVLATIHSWKDQRGLYFRGQHVPWDDDRYFAAFRQVAEMVIEGRMKNHRYIEELLVDPNFPPKSGEKPANAPESAGKKVETVSKDPIISAHIQAISTSDQDRKRRASALTAAEEWAEKVDAWLREHSDRARALKVDAEEEIEKSIPRSRETVFNRAVTSKVRLLAAEEAGIPQPE